MGKLNNSMKLFDPAPCFTWREIRYVVACVVTACTLWVVAIFVYVAAQ